MAKFSFNGVDEISASFEQLASIGDEEKKSILQPAADFLRKKYVEKIKSSLTQRTGALAASVSVGERTVDDNPALYIYFKGKHPGSSTGKRKPKRGKSRGRYSGTNAEVMYILEYGSPRIQAKHLIEATNDENEDAVADAMEAAWNDLLTQKGF